MSDPAADSSPSAPPRHRRHWRQILRYKGRNLLRAVSLNWFPGARLFRRTPKATLVADARAGSNVALLAFPQSIAYALIAGLPPQVGLIAAGVTAIVGPLFSGTRFLVIGPTNATAIMLFAGLTSAGLTDEQKLVALPLFVLLVGLFLVLAALARASLLLSYISRTVVTGYVTAAAALIFINQVPHALGFRLEGASTFLAMLIGTIKALPQTQWPTALLAVSTLAFHLAFKRWLPALPGVALTLVVASLVGAAFSWLDWPVAFLGGFALSELRVFSVDVDFQLVGQMAGPALALAFIGALEGTSAGKSLAARAGGRFDVNQELYGMGMGNIASALTGGMNASGSLTRSVLNASSGARSPLASILGGVFILLMLFTLGFFIRYIPTAAVAVVVMCIAVALFDRYNLQMALRTTFSDGVVFFVTCLAALLFTLEAAIYLGAFTSIVLFLKKAGTPDLVEYNFNPDGQLAELAPAGKRAVPGISILHAEGDLFFGSTEIFSAQMREVIRDPSLKVIVLRLKNARNLDATAAAAIEEMHDFLRKSGRYLLVSGAGREVTRVMRNAGLLAKIGEANYFREVPTNPTLSTRHALKRAVEVLGRRDVDIRIFVDPSKQKQE